MRTIICTVAAVLATILLIAMTPQEQFAPRGIALPAAHIRAAISPDAVTIAHEPLQGNYQTLGDVRTEIAFKTLNLEVRHQLFEKVKTLAASIGANTVLVRAIVPGGIAHMVTFVGTAVYVPPKTQGAKS